MIRRLLLTLPILCSWCDPSHAFLHDRVEMTVSGTPGTGTITLGSAVPGYLTFSAGGVIDAELVSYVVIDGSNWELDRAVYTASGTTLARGVLYSSNSNSAVSLTSSAIVFIAALAEDFGKTYTPTITSHNYNVQQSDCNTILLLPSETSPTITLPNINAPTVGKCVIGLVQTSATTYTIQAASGGTVAPAAKTTTAGINTTVVAILITPSVSAAAWVLN